MFLEIRKRILARHYQIRNSETNPHSNLSGVSKKGISEYLWLWAIWTKRDQESFPRFSNQNKGIEEIHLLLLCYESGLSLKWGLLLQLISSCKEMYLCWRKCIGHCVWVVLLLHNDNLKRSFIFFKIRKATHNKCKLKIRRQLPLKKKQTKTKNCTFEDLAELLLGWLIGINQLLSEKHSSTSTYWCHCLLQLVTEVYSSMQ